MALNGSVNAALSIRRFRVATPKQTFPAMWQAGLSAVARLQVACPPDNTTKIEIEAETSHAAADVIFRTCSQCQSQTGLLRRCFNNLTFINPANLY